MCMVARVGDGRALWHYESTDIHGTVAGADYFTDGHAQGMRVGDSVLVHKTSATIGNTLHRVITATVNGAATVSAAILA